MVIFVSWALHALVVATAIGLVRACVRGSQPKAAQHLVVLGVATVVALVCLRLVIGFSGHYAEFDGVFYVDKLKPWAQQGVAGTTGTVVLVGLVWLAAIGVWLHSRKTARHNATPIGAR